MLTRYTLHIGNEYYELTDSDLSNWEEIKVSYKRAAFDGVVRTFSSQFKFVGTARELLLDLYRSKGVKAEASITVSVMNDRWVDEERFTCPLDFSTMTHENLVLSINSVDTSVAARIKADKSTKYEFVIGADIRPDTSMLFDRIPMLESATYEFTQGITYEDTADITVSFEAGELPWVGLVGSEVTVNGKVHFLDDQDPDGDAYVLKAYKDVEITIDFDFEWNEDEDATVFNHGSVDLGADVKRGAATAAGATLGSMASGVWKHLKYTDSVPDFPNPGTLQSQRPASSVANDKTYATVVGGGVFKCTYNGRDWDWVSTGLPKAESFLNQTSGRRELSMKAGDTLVINAHTAASSGTTRIRFTRTMIKFSWSAKGDPVTLQLFTPENVLGRLMDKITGGATVRISNYRMYYPGTYLMAAESLRGIPGAKLYTSFNDFANWMETVFGYVYVTGTTTNGRPLVEFLHRDELFAEDAPVRKIADTKEHKYSVDTSLLFSTLTIGYDKKDYDNVNGRDEFNFNNTYSTDITVSDKTLSLLSKYRADSYGVEFAVQKRGEDTTDSTSDQDVFFIRCVEKDGVLVPDRQGNIKGALNDFLFNGMFVPYRCILANSNYLCAGAPNVTLTFASSTGNTEVEIFSQRVAVGLSGYSRNLTPGVLEFVTDDVDDIADPNELIEVEDMEGTVYRGYLKEVDISYAMPESAKYKIIVKEIIR